MKFLVASLALAATAGAFSAEIQTVEEMGYCIEGFVENNLSKRHHIRWDKRPLFDFKTKTYKAVWYDMNVFSHGVAVLKTTPDSKVYCDYDMTQLGFCEATVSEGKVNFLYESYDLEGRPVLEERTFAEIRNAKVFCLN